MKKNDIAIIILVVAISGLVAYFAGQAVLTSQKADKPVSVETAEMIDAAVVEPEAKIFHKDAINPTVKIEIGDINQQQPFDD